MSKIYTTSTSPSNIRIIHTYLFAQAENAKNGNEHVGGEMKIDNEDHIKQAEDPHATKMTELKERIVRLTKRHAVTNQADDARVHAGTRREIDYAEVETEPKVGRLSECTAAGVGPHLDCVKLGGGVCHGSHDSIASFWQNPETILAPADCESAGKIHPRTEAERSEHFLALGIVRAGQIPSREQPGPTTPQLQTLGLP